MASSSKLFAAALAASAGGVLAASSAALGQAAGQAGQPLAHPPHTRFYPPPHLPTQVGVDQKKGVVGDADSIIAPSKAGDKGDKAGPNHEIVSKDGRFKLDFDKVEIMDLVQSISDMTGKLFIVPENIHGKITIIGPKHGTEWVTAAEAYAAFLAALDSTNLAIYPMGKYNKIVEKRDARRKAVPTFIDAKAEYPDSEQYITKLFRLKHTDPDTVQGLLAELLGPDGMIRPFQPDLLIIADQALNMHRLETILEQIDVSAGGDEVRILQVTFAAAQDLAEKLTNIFQNKDKKAGGGRGLSVAPLTGPGYPAPRAGMAGGAPEDEGGGVNLTKVIPDERTNKLVVVASPASFAKIEALVKQLDVPVPGEGQIHVFYLENAEAEKVSTTLTNLISGIAQGKKAGGGAAAGAPAANQSVFEGQVKISPDKATNSLVIVGTGTDYANLVKVIERLDKPQRQVFVEAVIMEVNINSELDFGGAAHYIATPTINGQQVPIPIGAEPFAIGKGINSLLGISGLASLGGFLTGLQGPANSTIGQALGIAIPSFSVMVQALETNGATNVISTPHILTTNNEEAEITVGQNVPFQSGFSLGGLGGLGALAGGLGASSALGSTGTTSPLGGLGLGSLPIGQIQRQNVELKLKLKPQINSGDFVRLTVDESTEEIASTDPILGPTTSKRSAKTVIVAKDQETVVIGGLMQDRVIKSSNKTPVLGDIPILGWLFRYDTTTKQKVNLLLFLTPYIIRDASDFRTIFERKMREREEFVERFYGDSVNYHVPIDYERKTGPLGSMTVNLRHEQNKVENGGTGQDSGEHAIGPKRLRPLFGPGAALPAESPAAPPPAQETPAATPSAAGSAPPPPPPPASAVPPAPAGAEPSPRPVVVPAPAPTTAPVPGAEPAQQPDGD